MDAALLLPHDITPHPSAVSDALAANHLASFRSVISASYSNSLFNWNFQASPPQSTPLPGHTHWVTCLAVSRGGTLVASGSNDCTVRLWDLASSTLVHIFKGHDNWVNTVAFSPDGLLVASGSHDGTVRLWNVKTGKSVGKPFEQADNWIYSVAFSPDGTRLISAGSDRTIRVLDLHAAAQLTAQPLAQHTALIRSVAYSPDGTKIAAGDLDGLIRLWDTRTGLQIGDSLTGHTAGIYSVAFSPDGARIVSGGEDNTVRIWDATTGLQIGSPLISHLFNVRSVAFSPDGRWIASASEDKTVRIWNATTGLPLGEPLGHSNQVCAVVFAPAALPPAAPAATADQPTPDTRPSVASTAATSATADIPSADLSPAAAAPDSALAAPPPAVIPLSDLPAAVTEPTEPTDMAEPAAAAAEAEPTEPTEPAEPTECFVVSVQAAEPPTATDTALTQCHPEEFGDSGPVSLVSGTPGLSAHAKLPALLRQPSRLPRLLRNINSSVGGPGTIPKTPLADGGPSPPAQGAAPAAPTTEPAAWETRRLQLGASLSLSTTDDDDDEEDHPDDERHDPGEFPEVYYTSGSLKQEIIECLNGVVSQILSLLIGQHHSPLPNFEQIMLEICTTATEFIRACSARLVDDDGHLRAFLGALTTVLYELYTLFQNEHTNGFGVDQARTSIEIIMGLFLDIGPVPLDAADLLIDPVNVFAILTEHTCHQFVVLLFRLVHFGNECMAARTQEPEESCRQFAERCGLRLLAWLWAQSDVLLDNLLLEAELVVEGTPHRLEDGTIVLFQARAQDQGIEIDDAEYGQHGDDRPDVEEPADEEDVDEEHTDADRSGPGYADEFS
eukprot:m.606888 g.606888  ORF g.606888 m.606888 type:complete len:841 (-) comp58115_c0_seq2:186-2708(-)